MAAARAYPPAFDRAFAASQQTASRLRDGASFGRRHSLASSSSAAILSSFSRIAFSMIFVNADISGAGLLDLAAVAELLRPVCSEEEHQQPIRVLRDAPDNLPLIEHGLVDTGDCTPSGLCVQEVAAFFECVIPLRCEVLRVPPHMVGLIPRSPCVPRSEGYIARPREAPR